MSSSPQRRVARSAILVAQLLGGARVRRVESFTMEDGALVMTLELAGGRLCSLSFAPGQPILARVVA